MATLEKVNQTLKDQESTDKKGFEGTISAVESLNNTMQSFVKMVQLQNMKLLEAMREKQAATAAPAEEVKPEKPKNKLNLILLGIIALLGGILKGVADSLRLYAKMFQLDKLMDLLKTRITNLGKNVSAGLNRLLAPIRAFFSSTGGRLVAIADDFSVRAFVLYDDALIAINKALQPIRAFFAGTGESSMSKLVGGIVKFIRNAFMFPLEPLADLVKPFKAIFTGGEDGVSLITRIVNTIKAPFVAAEEGAKKALNTIKSAFAIFDEGSKFMTALKSIGRAIGRLFFPITFILAAVDTVKGAMKGYDEEGIGGFFKGAVEGLLNSLVGAPLDLLTKAVAWMLGKLGFDESSEALKKFSFSDIITDIIMSPIEMLKRAFNGIIESIASAIERYDIPFVDEKEAADKLRSIKFEEGKTRSEQRAEEAAAAEEKARIEQEENPNAFDRISRKLERGRARAGSSADGSQVEELQSFGSGTAGAPVSVVNAPSTSVTNHSNSNNQAIISPVAGAFDNGDPLFKNEMVWT